MSYKWNYFQKLLVVISLFFLSLQSTDAAEENSENTHEQLYKNGLTYRNEYKWSEAIDCFTPLAERDDLKAQHNLAFSLYNFGDERSAYNWYKKASEQGFKPSENNLRKMNLLCLLIPNEMLMHVVSFFTRQDVYRFSLVSQNNFEVVRKTVSLTNLLISKSPYALEFMTLFKDIKIEPLPKAIRILREAKVIGEGDVEIHFRDTAHLKKIVDEIPLISGGLSLEGSRVYYVRDKDSKDGCEIISKGDNLVMNPFINFVSDSPLVLSGKSESKIPFPIHFPLKSDISQLSFKTEGGIITGELKNYQEAHELSEVIGEFNEYLFKIRTSDAFQLLINQRKSRLELPNFYPDLIEVCPDICLIGLAGYEILQQDYICSKQPLVYISNSLKALTELYTELPDFSNSISYIDPDFNLSGVYCNGPLFVQKGFDVFANGDLSVSGQMDLYDHNIKFRSIASLWLMSLNLSAKSILIRSGKDLSINGKVNPNVKPENMLDHDWQKLREFWLETGRMRIQ